VESTAPTPLRATAATVKRQYSPPGESNCTGIADGNAECFRQSRTDDHRARVVAKILKLTGDDLLANIGCSQMERGIDSKEIDGRGFKLRPAP
jgi:hypothetical protein